jgi:hypothetical protein
MEAHASGRAKGPQNSPCELAAAGERVHRAPVAFPDAILMLVRDRGGMGGIREAAKNQEVRQ